MMENNVKKSNDTKKILITLAAVIVIVIVISSSTYSYWRWESLTTNNGGSTSNNQQTNINVTVQGGSLTIDGTNITQTGVTLYPVKQSNCASNALVGTATVTAVNQTETPMTVTLLLKGTLKTAQGTLNTNACGSGGNKSCLRWAVIESDTNSFTSTCVNPTYKGTFKDVSTNTDMQPQEFEDEGDSNTTMYDATTPITWTAAATSTSGTSASSEVTTIKYYKVYVWLDSAYTFTNYGTTVTDPMQNLKITLTWSTNSTLVQNASS